MVPTLDVRRCNAEKKYAGELRFGFDPDPTLVDIPYVAFSSPVEADLHYEILEGDWVEVKGTLSFSLKGLCSRCLKETEQRLTAEAEGCFIPEGNGSDDYAYRNGIVDLTEFLRDAVLGALPNGLYCSDTCSAPEYDKT